MMLACSILTMKCAWTTGSFLTGFIQHSQWKAELSKLPPAENARNNTESVLPTPDTIDSIRYTAKLHSKSNTNGSKVTSDTLS